VPGELTEITEVATALGMLNHDLATAATLLPPAELANVPLVVWQRLIDAYAQPRYRSSFERSFENGQAFLRAADGLRGRRPRLVEWKGPHRPPGDDVIPADLRIDRVYLVSCKYLSRVLLNPGPARLFERLLVGDERSSDNWFARVAPAEFQAFYEAAVAAARVEGLPADVTALSRPQQRRLKDALGPRSLPAELRPSWQTMCDAVAQRSAATWDRAMASPRERLRLLWRLLRVTTATYFVLGTDTNAHLRLRVDSAWDWMQTYELRSLEVTARTAGQPEVSWMAVVRSRATRHDIVVHGHVEIRWSHGRFVGTPEAKVYLDTPHTEVPGFHLLA
jgi:hypothetical protein